MAGTINVTIEELKEVKFDVIEHFGMSRNGHFFIMNTVEPVEYGADCKDYTWYQVMVKKEHLPSLGDYINRLFGKMIDVTSVKAACEAVNALDIEFHDSVEPVDWGACHVLHIPYADQFRKVGVVNG